MAKQKLQKFSEYKSFPNTFDFAFELKGFWAEKVFKNKNPIVLELACGKGEYSVNLAQLHPQKNFIGIDIKSNRMWRGAKTAFEKKIANVAFMRASIEKISDLFDEAEITEIWITFPDPYPKDKHEKYRLTHVDFLRMYKKILKPNGFIHFKTDDDGLFDFTLQVLTNLKIKPVEIITNVHEDELANEHLKNITTHYEKLFIGKGEKIKYCRFSLENL